MTQSDRMLMHWSPRSPFVRKALIAAHELGLFERLDLVRTFVAMDKPNADLLPDNPLNKIPTLVLPSGQRIYDSLVICEYLDLIAGGGRLFPSDPEARILALRRHALGTGFLDLLILFRNERDRPDGARSQPHLTAFGAKVVATLQSLEREIGELPRDRFGIEHIAIGCALSYLDFRFETNPWRKDHPALAAWQDGFDARPSALATRAREG